MKLPGPDATLSELQAHAANINALLTSKGYFDRLATCQGCGSFEENQYGREFGHARFCTRECEAVMDRLETLRNAEIKRRVLEGPSPLKLKRRRRRKTNE